jgi:hypothetical protein
MASGGYTRNRFDRIAKHIGQEALRASGATVVQEEISAEPALLSFQRLVGQRTGRDLDDDEQEFIMAMIKSWEEGRAEARAEARCEAVLTVLGARGIAVPDAARTHILAQKDLALLERWLIRASVASSVGEVIDDPS